MTWLPAFLGALFGSFGAYAAALLSRGTALETSLQELAVDLHRQVREQTMTVQGAGALLEASRPDVHWWSVARARRVSHSVDVWLDRFDEAQLLSGTLPPGGEPDYPVPGEPDQRGEERR